MAQTIADERILVTGATGYVGSFLVPQLLQNNEVHVLARDGAAARASLQLPSGRVHSDLKTPGAVSQAFDTVQPTLVFHLATHYEKRDDATKVEAMVDANVRFGSLVLEAASRQPACDVVVAGSHFQFAGEAARSASFYAATKNALCEVARYLQEAKGLRWIQTVLFDVYGPADPRTKLVSLVVERILAGDPVSLPDPEPLHHFVYIDDVVDALVASALELRSDNCLVGGNVFVTSDELVAPSAVVAEVATQIGVAPLLNANPYPLPPGSIMVPAGGPRPRNWKPLVGLKQGIETLVDSAGA